jgi:peroxiredoxin
MMGIREALRVPERPVAPDPRFRETLFERLVDEAARQPGSFRPRQRHRLIGPTPPRGVLAVAVLVATFAIFAAVVWPLRGSTYHPASEITPSTPFRATIVGSFPTTAQTDFAGDFELRLSYRAPDAWRIDLLGGSAPGQPLINENVHDARGYVLWNGERLIGYDARSGSFVPQPLHAEWFSPLNLLGFFDAHSWQHACESGSRLGDDTVAGRPVHVLRCPAPASFSSRSAEVQLWVDADSGLILKLVSSEDPGQLFPPGPIAWYAGEQMEITSIEYDPTFDAAEFVVPPEASSVPPTQPAPTSLTLGEVVPSFSGKTLDGATFDLPDERGKPTLVYLWADWCRPCTDFPLDALDRASATANDLNVVTVGLQVDPSSISGFVRQNGYRFAVVLPDDPVSLNDRWGLQGVPTLVLLDAQGRFVAAYGAWNSEVAKPSDLDAVLEALASGGPFPEIPGASSQFER